MSLVDELVKIADEALTIAVDHGALDCADGCPADIERLRRGLRELKAQR